MAVTPVRLSRNSTESDAVAVTYNSNQPFPSETDAGWSVTGKVIVNWNTSSDGSGSSYAVHSPIIDAVNATHGVTQYYAIWGTVDVTITYQGSSIATMSDSGTKTLLTADNYCEDDIIVSYTKPSAPAPNLQAKTNIVPTTSSQTITADSGYDGLSSVQINAISPVRTSSDLTASGATVSVPAGYYASSASKSVATGSARTPNTSIYANAQYYLDEWGTLSIYISGSQSVTPTVTAGYVSSGTAGTITVYGTWTYQVDCFDGTVDDYNEEEESGGGGA